MSPGAARSARGSRQAGWPGVGSCRSDDRFAIRSVRRCLQHWPHWDSHSLLINVKEATALTLAVLYGGLKKASSCRALGQSRGMRSTLVALHRPGLIVISRALARPKRVWFWIGVTRGWRAHRDPRVLSQLLLRVFGAAPRRVRSALSVLRPRWCKPWMEPSDRPVIRAISDGDRPATCRRTSTSR